MLGNGRRFFCNSCQYESKIAQSDLELKSERMLPKHYGTMGRGACRSDNLTHCNHLEGLWI